MTSINCSIRAQGRVLSPEEFVGLQTLIDEHPQWSRHRIGQELCRAWDWRTCAGQLKTYAARTFLLTLEQRHQLRLPAVRAQWRRRPWGIKLESSSIPRPTTLLACSLEALQPLTWEIASYGTEQRQRALGLLRQFHYLGCNRPVGAHLLYLVKDGQGRELAVHLVGAAVWQCAPRDAYVGWNSIQRTAHLPGVGNHSRFLILPWVRVPHLASHLLSQLTRRLAEDWPRHHGWKLSWPARKVGVHASLSDPSPGRMELPRGSKTASTPAVAATAGWEHPGHVVHARPGQRVSTGASSHASQ